MAAVKTWMMREEERIGCHSDSDREAGDEPRLCEECGRYPADRPSRVCPGCEAYREHRQ